MDELSGVPVTRDAAAAAAGRARTAAGGASGRRSSEAGLCVTLLGTNGGPPPLAARYGISSAVVVNGKTYVVDCGRGAVSQYVKAGLSMSSLTAIFLTHLHADHTVDAFSFPLLAGGGTAGRGFSEPIGIYGPGPSGLSSLSAGIPAPRRRHSLAPVANRASA